MLDMPSDRDHGFETPRGITDPKDQPDHSIPRAYYAAPDPAYLEAELKSGQGAGTWGVPELAEPSQPQTEPAPASPPQAAENPPSDHTEDIGRLAVAAHEPRERITSYISNDNNPRDGSGQEYTDDDFETVEINNLGERKLAINRSYPDQETVNTAIEQFRDGLPENLHEIYRTSYIERAHLADADPDSGAQPKFFVKVTHLPEEIDPEEAWQYPKAGEDEIRISQQVQTALDTEEAQNIASRHGFASVSLVSPLLAINDEENRIAARIFPWQEGSILEGARGWGDRTPAPAGTELAKLNNATDELAALLLQKGIVPREFAPDHILVSRDNEGHAHLHVIDVEHFEIENQPG